MNVKRLLTAFLLVATASVSADVSSNAVITTAAEVVRRMLGGKFFESRFDLTVTVHTPYSPSIRFLAVHDDSGSAEFLCNSTTNTITAGDLIRITGSLGVNPLKTSGAYVEDVEIIKHGPTPKPLVTTPANIHRGDLDYQFVTVTGMLCDSFQDEIDPKFTFLVVRNENKDLYASVALLPVQRETLKKLVGATIAVAGTVAPCLETNRKRLGRTLHVADIESIKTVQPPGIDPFSVEEIPARSQLTPQEILALGKRKVRGHVVAVWQGDSVLVMMRDGQFARLELADAIPPHYGDAIEAVGQTETDLYRINLTRAIWRKAMAEAFKPETAVPVSARVLTTDEAGQTQYKAPYYGHAIRIEGKVKSVPRSGFGNDLMYVDDNGLLVPVDASATPEALRGVKADSRVAVSGTCVMDIDNWRPNAVFPRIRGFRIVVRTPEDVEILAHPPWWTPARLFAVIGSLLAALVAFAVWTVLLRRLAERRGRQLAEEEVAHLGASLRVEERTRLAVELHDSISQNLTAVALEIKAGHNDVAQQTLKSCREELRNCLWDLRHNTLGIADMNEAIRQTLKPQIGETALAVRFFVDRKLIPDNVAHMILKIIRELAVNAVRHGQATALKVAGSIEDGRLLFSVADNGCGFDPDAAPGPAQGHFGLLGVRERVEGSEGELDISSTPGKGTKVTISIKIPRE